MWLLSSISPQHLGQPADQLAIIKYSNNGKQWFVQWKKRQWLIIYVRDNEERFIITNCVSQTRRRMNWRTTRLNKRIPIFSIKIAKNSNTRAVRSAILISFLFILIECGFSFSSSLFALKDPAQKTSPRSRWNSCNCLIYVINNGPQRFVSIFGTREKQWKA